MSNPWVWGPSPVYLGGINANASACQFLGWTQSEGPQIEIVPTFEPVDVTIAGSRNPFDESYQGQSGTIQLALTDFNEPIASNILEFTGLGVALGAGLVGGAGLIPGFETGSDAGSLMMSEGLNLTVMILAPNSSKAFYAAQLPGMRFPNCRVSTARMGPLGTKPRIFTVAFNANRYFSPTGGTATYAPWTMTLWDKAVSGAPVPR